MQCASILKRQKISLNRDIWEVVATYVKDPLVYDEAPSNTMQKIFDYAGEKLTKELLSVPLLRLAGGSVVPVDDDVPIADLDFFYEGSFSGFYALYSKMKGWNRSTTRNANFASVEDMEMKTIYQMQFDECIKYDVHSLKVLDEDGKRVRRFMQGNKFALFKLSKYNGLNVVFSIDIVWIGVQPLYSMHYFALDYQQCMILAKTKNGSQTYVRARTTYAYHAHMSRRVSFCTDAQATFRQLEKLESKMKRKKYAWRANVESVYQFPFVIHIQKNNQEMHYDFERSSIMVGDSLPDWAPPNSFRVSTAKLVSDIQGFKALCHEIDLFCEELEQSRIYNGKRISTWFSGAFDCIKYKLYLLAVEGNVDYDSVIKYYCA